MNHKYFTNLYYRSLLPIDKINVLLKNINLEVEAQFIQLLTSILNLNITTALLKHFSSLKEKKNFLRLYQDDFADEKILDYLIDSFPGSQQIISETIDRTVLIIQKDLES